MDKLLKALEDLRGDLAILRDQIDKQEQLHRLSNRSDPAYAAWHEMEADLLILRKIRRELVTKQVDKQTSQRDHPELHLPLFSGHCPRRYEKHQAELEKIFTDMFPNCNPESYKRDVLPLAVIPETTIYRWKKKWELKPSWRPWHMQYNHGSQNRLFDDQEEAEIAAEIMSRYIGQQHLFTSATFTAIASEKWAELGRNPNQFKCSDKFICGFKERNGFSTPRCHLKRRDPEGEEQNVEI
jgi:hypothetical protein